MIIYRTEFSNVLAQFNSGTYEYQISNEFIKYLDDSQYKNIKAVCLGEKGDEIYHDFGYPHRWSEDYTKGRYAKMYRLEEWVKAHSGIPVTFLSLTVRQDKDELGRVKNDAGSMVKYFDKLTLGWKRMRTAFQHMNLHLDYVGTCEPHETGNPHFHIVIFHKFTQEQINYLNKMWEKWDMGSYEHGLDFDYRENTSIKNIRSYLLSYMLKSLPNYSSKFKECVSWTSEELLFNAVAWKYHYRTWFASNPLSRVMKYDVHRKEKEEFMKNLGDESLLLPYVEFLKSNDDKIEWIETRLELKDDEDKVLWKRKNESVLLL